jgi:hypothetical protein
VAEKGVGREDGQAGSLQATLDALQELPEIGTQGPVGYFGQAGPKEWEGRVTWTVTTRSDTGEIHQNFVEWVPGGELHQVPGRGAAAAVSGGAKASEVNRREFVVSQADR